MPHDHGGTLRSTPAQCARTALLAVALGASGLLLVAAAVSLSVVAQLTVAGLVLASAGVMLAAGGLTLGTLTTVRARQRAHRAAISAAALSVIGLATGLTWLATFVIATLLGPAPTTPAEGGATPVCGSSYQATAD